MMARPPERMCIWCLLAGMFATVLLAALCHALGIAREDQTPGYGLTEYFTGCISLPVVCVYVGIGATLGGISRLSSAPAIGLALPLPLACMVEVVLRPSHHNLWPFELVLLWLPAFGIAWLGAIAGKSLVTRVK